MLLSSALLSLNNKLSQSSDPGTQSNDNDEEEDDDKGGKDENHLYNKMIMTKVKTKVAKT